MSISPIHCPDSGCYWSAHGIPDKYTEARAWHLAAHRAEEHDEPLTAEQLAYATKAGHVIPGSALTTAAAVAAQGALPVPVGDQPQPLDDTRLAEIATRVEAATPGPWRWEDDRPSLNRFVTSEDYTLSFSLGYVGNRTQDDAEFIAHAREDVPALLAAVTYHRHWEQVGWQKAHAYNELWGRADDRLAEERQLVARLRQELSRQGRAHKAEVERLKAELARAHEDSAFLERNTLPELRRTVEHHQAGKQRWRERAEKAEARVAELADYEVMNPQQCAAGKHADWLVDSEYTHACPWCEIERLKAELAEAHQKKTAALASARQLMNRNRTEEAS